MGNSRSKRLSSSASDEDGPKRSSREARSHKAGDLSAKLSQAEKGKADEPTNDDEEDDDDGGENAADKDDVHPDAIDEMGCVRRSVTIIVRFLKGKKMEYQNLSPGAWFGAGVGAMLFLDVFSDLIAFCISSGWWSLGVKIIILTVLVAYLLFLQEVANAFAGDDKAAHPRGCCSCCARAALVFRGWYNGKAVNFEEISSSTWFVASCASYMSVNIVIQFLQLVVSSKLLQLLIEASLDFVIVMSILSIKGVAKALLAPQRPSILAEPAALPKAATTTPKGGPVSIDVSDSKLNSNSDGNSRAASPGPGPGSGSFAVAVAVADTPSKHSDSGSDRDRRNRGAHHPKGRGGGKRTHKNPRREGPAAAAAESEERVSARAVIEKFGGAF